MEFINCSFSYSYEPSYKKSYKNMRLNKSKFVQSDVVKERPITNFHEIFAKLKGETALNIKNLRSFFREILKFWFVLPILSFAILACFFSVKFVNYSESYAKKINLNGIFDSDYEFVNNAMNEFASETTWFDLEGNVITQEGETSLTLPEFFKESIKYETYTVKSGDTISGISVKFGLSNISTLIAVNNISNVRTLTPGTKLQIPSMDGLIYTVKSGESLASLSVKYQIAVEDLLDVNDLSSDNLKVGQKLFIPGARLDSNTLLKAMGEIFVYPISSGWRLSSNFGPRKDPFTGIASNHTGIDMAAPKGTPIKASKTGTVSYTGFSSVYGNYVIVNHTDGYQTLYAHMSKILVKKGQRIAQGERLGLVGSTGYSTGNHLHFTVYKNGKLVNPLTVLK